MKRKARGKNTQSAAESKPEIPRIDWSTVPVIKETELEYEYNEDGTVSITGYLGSETVLNYPAEICGMQVTDIDPPENCTAVKLPDGMTEVRCYMFYNRPYLESVVIPDSVTVIRGGAFRDCGRLKSVTMPKTLKLLEDEVFMNCQNLIEVTIPEGITAIESDTFGDCYSLEHITVPDGVKNIKMYAFIGCVSLQSIELPDSVIWINTTAFYCCPGDIIYKGVVYNAESIEELYDKDLGKM